MANANSTVVNIAGAQGATHHHYAINTGAELGNGFPCSVLMTIKNVRTTTPEQFQADKANLIDALIQRYDDARQVGADQVPLPTDIDGRLGLYSTDASLSLWISDARMIEPEELAERLPGLLAKMADLHRSIDPSASYLRSAEMAGAA